LPLVLFAFLAFFAFFAMTNLRMRPLPHHDCKTADLDFTSRSPATAS
jgi:hypothetical protein